MSSSLSFSSVILPHTTVPPCCSLPPLALLCCSPALHPYCTPPLLPSRLPMLWWQLLVMRQDGQSQSLDVLAGLDSGDGCGRGARGLDQRAWVWAGHWLRQSSAPLSIHCYPHALNVLIHGLSTVFPLFD
jgi:hypothetical protein